MTDFSPLRKAILACAALALTAGLNGCDSKQSLTETLAQLKDEPVDSSPQPQGGAGDRQIGKKDVDLAINTAKDLTINKGGLLNKDGKPSSGLQIQIVDPKEQPQADGAPLDERLANQSDGLSAAQTAAAHDLPDVPIAHQASSVPAFLPQRTYASLLPKPAARLVQVGSFSSVAAAQSAWAGLRSHAPGYSASYQQITTVSGKTMVRLKVGPVKDDSQAQSLCSQLAIRDAWCAKAS